MADGRTSEKNARKALAHHEAAHAVARCRQGVLLDVITIQPSDDYDGEASGDGTWDSEEQAEHVLVGLCAGYAAHRRCVPVELDRAARRSAHDDFEIGGTGQGDAARPPCRPPCRWR